jgi:hypothetical protein
VLICEYPFGIFLKGDCRHLVLFLAFKSIQRARDLQLRKGAPVDHAAITSNVTGELKSPDHDELLLHGFDGLMHSTD